MCSTTEESTKWTYRWEGLNQTDPGGIAWATGERHRGGLSTGENPELAEQEQQKTHAARTGSLGVMSQKKWLKAKPKHPNFQVQIYTDTCLL